MSDTFLESRPVTSSVSAAQATLLNESQITEIVSDINDEALRKDVAELLARTINARQRLSAIDLRPYSGTSVDFEGLEIWQKLAPQFGSAIGAVSSTLQFLAILAPEPPEDNPIDDKRIDEAFSDFDDAFSEEAFAAPAAAAATSAPAVAATSAENASDLRMRLANTAWAISFMLKDEIMRFGSRMRQSHVMMDRWNLLSELQETCHKLSKGLDALTMGICSAFSSVSRDEVIPGFRSELAFSLELRRLIFELRDQVRTVRVKMDALPKEQWRHIAEEIYTLIDNFVYGPAFGWLRAFDKREVIQFRKALRNTLDNHNASGRDFHEPIEGTVRFLEALEVINHREILVEHDRKVLTEAAAHLETAIRLPRMEGRHEFAAAISCLSKAWGRDPQLDAMVEMTLDPMADLKQEDILTRVQLVLSGL